MNGWPKDTLVPVRVFPGTWVPYSPEMAAPLLDWPVEQVREVFGDTVLARQTLEGLEFGRPDPAPDSPEVRADVTEIIERGVISSREQTGLLHDPVPRFPDPEQLRRDLFAARDGAWSA